MDVFDGAEHLLEVKPDFFQFMVVLNSVNILEKIATRHLFQNYVRAGSLIVWHIKYLLTVCVVVKHSNQVWVRVVLSAQTQSSVDLNFFIEISTSWIDSKSFYCNSSVLIVGCVPTYGLPTFIRQYIGARVSSIKNVSTPQFIFIEWLRQWLWLWFRQWFDHRIF